MTTVTAGSSVALLAQFFDFEGGVLNDLDATPSITIADIGTGVVALNSTTSGVTHPGTGSYGYLWSPASGLSGGSYLVTWSGLKSAVAVTATETLTVAGIATGVTASIETHGVWYCTRRDVKEALDMQDTARNNLRVDQAIETASRMVESLMHRRFYPRIGTAVKDWPNAASPVGYRLWLDDDEMISLTSISDDAGATLLDSGNIRLYPPSGPPYDRIELLTSGADPTFAIGSSRQQQIVISGMFGYRLTVATTGATAETLDIDEVSMNVSDGSRIAVGSILRVDDEWMVVTEESMITSGQTLQTPMTVLASNTAMTVTDGTLFFVGETLLLDSERMRIVDITGNILIVRRAWDGSTLATHTGSTIYALRTFIVTRGALGSTAATHSTATAIYHFLSPGGVVSLTRAEAISILLQDTSGWARSIRVGEDTRELTGRGLSSLRQQIYDAYGRKARHRAV